MAMQAITTPRSVPVRREGKSRWKLKFGVTLFLIFLALLAVIGGIKALQIFTMVKMGEPQMPPTTVTSACAQEENWAPELKATGSVAAISGAMLAAELPGTVAEVKFENGSPVEKNAVLIQLDVSAEQAQLRSAEADLELAKANEERARGLAESKVISKSEYDSNNSALKQKAAQVDNMRAQIEKKTVRAPFAGQAGIRQVNAGQMVPAGQALVALQSLDPIFVNFSLPQQQLSKLKEGLMVRLRSDALPGQDFAGKLTAVNPAIDEATRNVMIQATLENHQHLLRPGMFVEAAVILPSQEKTLVVPATAISYAPYGDSVYVIEKKQDEKTKKDELVLRQTFVRLGETRGDFVAITKGLTAGEQVVSTGVFKLRNAIPVVIDNALAPDPKLNPEPPNT